MNATSNPARKTVRKAKPAKAVAAPAQEAITAFDFLERIESLYSHTEGRILSTLETDRFHANCVPPVTPLPDWARERLLDQGRLDQAGTDFRSNVKALRTALQLAIDGVTSSTFEVWIPAKEPGYIRRYSTRIDSLEEARGMLAAVKDEFPTAYIAQTNRRSRPRGTDDLALLATLIGRVSIEGTFFPEDKADDIFEVEDETGRVVNVSATVLAGHEIFARLGKDDQAKVEFSVSRAARSVFAKDGAL